MVVEIASRNLIQTHRCPEKTSKQIQQTAGYNQTGNQIIVIETQVNKHDIILKLWAGNTIFQKQRRETEKLTVRFGA